MDFFSSINKIIPTRILISENLVFFTTAIGKVDISGNWCHWCDISPKEWEK